jgi:hypothetical protein
VTDPAHVKSEKSAQLDAAGPFDFVAALGERAELVRFRDGHGDAVLDLHRRAPVLRKIQGSKLQGATTLLGGNGLTVTGPVLDAPSPEHNGRDYQVFQNARSQTGDRVIDVKEVRQETINGRTGTTFLLSEKGLYLIRRPALETAPDMYGGR